MSQVVTASNGSMSAASSTQTQEEVNAAVGLDKEGKPLPEVKETKETSEAQAETVVEPETTEEVQEAEEGEKKSKGKTGFQKRIDKLTADKYRLEAELEEMRASKTTKTQETAQPAQVQAEGEPRIEDFTTIPDYVKAHTKWALAEAKKSEQAEAQQSRDREVLDNYTKRVADERVNHEDWDEVYDSIGEATVPQPVQLALLKRKDGPLLVYHLAKNPEIVDALNQMDPLEAVSELGYIAASISSSRSENSAPAVRVSSAPAPIKPVGGANTKSRVPLDKMPMKEYMAARKAGRTA